MDQRVKNPPAMKEAQETRIQFLGWENLLEKEMTTHSSILAWKIPWTEEPSRLQSVHWVANGWTRLSNFLSLFTLGWLDLLIQITKTFSISAIKPFCFLRIYVCAGVARLISFTNFSFAFQNLANYLVQDSYLLACLGFQHVFLTKMNHFQLLI